MERDYIVKYSKIDIDSFIEKYVDIEEVEGYCKECRHYGKIYSCPKFDFDVLAHWRKYKYLHVFGFIINLTEEEKSRQFDKDTFYDEMDRFYTVEKEKITSLLYDLIKNNKNSEGLGAGKCNLCKKCAREVGLECLHKDKLLYSIESLGGKVSEITNDLLGIKLVWSKDYKLPIYITSVIGLLSNEENINYKIIEKYIK